MTSKEESILSSYIKQGWSLTDIECPICLTPLLKKGTKYFCGICNREIKIAEDIKEYLKFLEENIKNELREKVIRSLSLMIKDKDVLDEEIVRSIEIYIKLLKELKDL